MDNTVLAAVGPAETATADLPNLVAVEAPVMYEIPLLQAFRATSRTDTAFMQPITVGIQAVLDVVLINGDTKAGRQLARFFPRRYL